VQLEIHELKRFLPVSQPVIGEKEIQYVTDAVKSGWVSSLGRYIESFERAFAVYCGTRYALAVSNGTTALHLALVAVGIKPGDEVIVPDLTFVATANAVAYTGATVVPVDIEADSLCIDPAAIEEAITPRTRAIIPVHLYGQPARMDAILTLARQHNLHVVEDAAEAPGAEFHGNKVGSFGDCGIFSFYGNKIITSGEGGMLTTNSLELYECAKLLRDHAMSPVKRYWHTQIGFNYRMTNLQAALGLAQLERIEEFLQSRRNIMQWYRDELAGDGECRLNRTVEGALSVYWMVCIEIDGLTYETRDSLLRELKANGVDSRPYFYPVSDLPMYERADTPIAHDISPKGLNLPSYFDLTRADVSYICNALRAALLAIGIPRRC
jgi:perosamine synthetase